MPMERGEDREGRGEKSSAYLHVCGYVSCRKPKLSVTDAGFAADRVFYTQPYAQPPNSSDRLYSSGGSLSLGMTSRTTVRDETKGKRSQFRESRSHVLVNEQYYFDTFG